MPKYEFCLSIRDEVDHTPGKVRKKEGDIVTVREWSWMWGSKEVDEYFIVIAETVTDYHTLRRHISHRLYQHLSTSDIWDSEEVDAAIHAETETMANFVAYAKNRYKIDFTNIAVSVTDLNMTKLQDPLYIYQPFKSAIQIAAPFDGLNNNEYMEPGDVDSFSTVADTNVEFSFNMDAISAIILDKKTDTLIKFMDL